MQTVDTKEFKFRGMQYCVEGEIEVTYYSHDPGVRTYSNGDPGYPPSTDMEWQFLEEKIMYYHPDGDVVPVTEQSHPNLYKALVNAAWDAVDDDYNIMSALMEKYEDKMIFNF